MAIKLHRRRAIYQVLVFLMGSVTLALGLLYFQFADRQLVNWCLLGANVIAAHVMTPALVHASARIAKVGISAGFCGCAIALLVFVETLLVPPEDGAHYMWGSDLWGATTSAGLGFFCGALVGAFAGIILAVLHAPDTST